VKPVEYVERTLTCDGVALADVAAKAGTPCYVYSAATILANCRVFVGNVGFLMHLARAVECRSVIVFGGREAPWQSGYSGNINLFSPVSCAPCWLWNKCDHDRICMDVITAEEVIDSVKLQLEMPAENLPVDQTVI